MLLIFALFLLATQSLCSPTGYNVVQQPAPEHLHAGVQPLPAKLNSGPSVVCRTEYVTLYDTKYVETETEVCTTEYEKVCHTETERLCKPTTRQVCEVKYEKQCQTVYKNVCVEQYRTEFEPYTETECNTLYKDDCEFRWEGTGNDKVWAPIPGTCKSNPYEECRDVQKQKQRQVPYPVCRDVPEQKCIDAPKQECHNVPDQVCTNQPLQKCQDVPRQACQQVHKKVPQRVSRQHPKKVCDHHEDQFGATLPAALPATPVATLPEIIAAKDNLPNVNVRSNDKLVFSS